MMSSKLRVTGESAVFADGTELVVAYRSDEAAWCYWLGRKLDDGIEYLRDLVPFDFGEGAAERVHARAVEACEGYEPVLALVSYFGRLGAE